MATEKEKKGTIHEIEAQLANLAEFDSMNPKTRDDIDDYIRIYSELKLFTPTQLKDKKKRDKLIKSIRVMNFSEDRIKREQGILKSINNFNKIIARQKLKIEKLIRAKKDVKKNDDILRGREKIEVKLPLKVRTDLKIHEKNIRLQTFSTIATANRIKFYSGQDYMFMVKDGFGKPFFISYDELQKIRIEGNVIEWLLKKFKSDVDDAYQRDKKRYFKDKKKWKSKEKVYNKIFKVLKHNLEIATNKKYNKKLVEKNEKGEIKKDTSEYPVFMEIFAEMIELYIP